MSFPLRAQVATVSAATGMGASNRSRYSNPEVDRLLAKAMGTVDDAQRERLLQQTSETAMADQALVPMFYGDHVYTVHKGLTYTARPDGYMAAFMVRDAK
jgi:peptide/nickel transport system substrate-binding protein